MSTNLSVVLPLERHPSLRRRPSSNRYRRPRPPELIFCGLVFCLYPDVRYEPETLETARGNNGQLTEAVTPDLYLPQKDVFLELTICDKFLEQDSLPEAVQIKNATRSQSRRPFISSTEYLARKQAKIDRAERIHDVRIILLKSSLQEEIITNPELLDELIAAKLGLAASRPLLHLV